MIIDRFPCFLLSDYETTIVLHSMVLSSVAVLERLAGMQSEMTEQPSCLLLLVSVASSSNQLTL